AASPSAAASFFGFRVAALCAKACQAVRRCSRGFVLVTLSQLVREVFDLRREGLAVIVSLLPPDASDWMPASGCWMLQPLLAADSGQQIRDTAHVFRAPVM
ncbi:TPA: hypothetical protein ACH3X2_000090, partial [Trebouxia sp. C0005]